MSAQELKFEADENVHGKFNIYVGKLNIGFYRIGDIKIFVQINLIKIQFRHFELEEDEKCQDWVQERFNSFVGYLSK